MRSSYKEKTIFAVPVVPSKGKTRWEKEAIAAEERDKMDKETNRRRMTKGTASASF